METSYSVVCFHFRFNIFAFTEIWSREREREAWGLLAEEKQQRQKGKRRGGMMEGAREGGSEVRGVKERWREGEERGDGRREGRWYRECERKGCEIERGRETKLEGEMERGMNCRGGGGGG